ncbi:hypothetical protein ACMS86_002339 [Escherichia coli O8:H25]
MTNNQLNRERLEKIKSWRETYGAGSNVMLPAEEAEELARIALAAMDSEPVATLDVQSRRPDGNKFALVFSSAAHKLPDDVYFLYRHAQQAPVVSADLLHTAASAIEDLLTTKDRTGAGVWFDLPFRLRSAANAQPAPVVPVTDAMAYAFHHALTDSPLGDDDVEDIKAGLRAALVNVFNTQPAPQEVHDEK